MINLMKADFYKMRKSATLWFTFLVMCVAVTVFAVLSIGMAKGSIGKETIGMASGLSDGSLTAIIGPFLAAIFICSDFTNKTMHDSILCGKGRRAIVYAKIIPYGLSILLMLLPYSILTIVGFLVKGSFSLDFANGMDSSYMMVLASQGSVAHDAEMILKMLLIVVVVAVMYIARMSLCILLGYTIRKPVLVVGIGFIVEMVGSLIALSVSSSEALTEALSWTPFVGIKETLNMGAAYSDLFKTLGASIVFIVIILNITSAIFATSEVK